MNKYPEVLTEKESRRFWDKVNKDGPLSDLVEGKCWVWTACKNEDGYGQFKLRYKMIYAHRLSYTINKLSISNDLVIDHLCRNRSCVNPDHLEPVTRQENIIRGETIPSNNLTKTHCPLNHLLVPPNLVNSEAKRGRRKCLACNRARAKYNTSKIRKGIILDPNLLQQVADEYYKEITQGV